MVASAQQVDSKERGFLAVGAIGANLRVKLSAGLVDVAGITDREIGVAKQAAYKANDPIAVTLRNSQGTMMMVAAGSITLNAAVYAAASGKISSTVSNVFIGYALSAATGNNSIIEVLPGNRPISGATITDAAGTIYKLAAGVVTLDGSNPTTVPTGLATIVGATVTRKSTAAPGVSTALLSVNFTGSDGNLDIYAWKPTASGDCTGIASTDLTGIICWSAFGT